ncbi:PREDICTED: UPF0693 protein C10orf32 homolog [Ceratosolen solmsi marchali]|uniref:BLOC-1-related complex subunit 7 n=1 Tax=Ceratosolen solmsi marchali TaxID=326594 RepID=A0AAJ7DT57_9HYME|nr:PREDICTED: UPF0693 protein C10orf32 homolog [Ceratosolen solmsi marchali]
MTSASSTSARNLFIDSKIRLADRVQVNINNIASLTRQIQRGSKSNEILMKSAKKFSQQEQILESVEMNMKKLTLIVTHLELQLNIINQSVLKLKEVTEQLRTMQQ